MILSAQSIPAGIVTPFVPAKTIHAESGMSYGLSCHGYDVRLAQDLWLLPFIGFRLGSTVERFDMPTHIMARVCDKSTLARQGITVQNTVIEAGWSGYMTLEITNHSHRMVRLRAGQPIAQVIFETLDQPTVRPYAGKYSDQPARPVPARREPATREDAA